MMASTGKRSDAARAGGLAWSVKVTLAVALVAALAPAAWATNTTCSGEVRDAGDYLCNKVTGVVPDISGTGTPINVWLPSKPTACAGDDCYQQVLFGGGRTFTWYGILQTKVFISSNGYVSFGKGYVDPANLISVPDPGTPNNAVYAYGADLSDDDVALDADFPGAYTGKVYYQVTNCLNGHSCFVVQWKDIAILDPAGSGLWDGTSVATVGLALDFATNQAYVEIFSETDNWGEDADPIVIGSESPAGLAGLWYTGTSPNGDSGQASSGDGYWFFQPDVTPPANITKQTDTSTDITSTVEFRKPSDGDFDGVLVLRSTNVPVSGVPTSGQAYTVGDQVGTDDVVCISTSADTACTDNTVVLGNNYFYKTFAFDTSLNYASGVSISAIPVNSGDIKFSINVNVASLNPPSTYGLLNGAPTLGIVEIGNDKLVHRFDEDGLRNGWNPPAIAGAVQNRAVVGDIGGPDYEAFITAQNGYLYRTSMTTGTTFSRNVAGTGGDAGCTGGLLQASPRVSLIDFGGLSSRVVVATRCSSTNNKILLYPLAVNVARSDLYPGVDDVGVTLGIANGAGIIIYRTGGQPALFVQPLRTNGTQPSLVTLELNAGGTFNHPAYAQNTGLGNLDAEAQLVKRGPNTWVAVGNTTGGVFILDATGPLNGGALALKAEIGTLNNLPSAGGNGAVKGIGVSTGVDVGGGQYENWVVWTTDTRIHGAKLKGNGTFDNASYWEHAISAPSAPTVLVGFNTGFRYSAFVGSGDGSLYVYDATNSTTTPFSRPVAIGYTLGQPTFDYNDGTNQGLVVGATNGFLYWVNLPISQ